MAATATASTGAQTGHMQRAKQMGEVLADNYMEKRAASSPDHDSRVRQSLTQTVQGIGAAVVTIAIVAILANAVLTTTAINNSSGPFSPIVDRLGTTGVAALGLLIVALIVAAAMVIMRMMEGGF